MKKKLLLTITIEYDRPDGQSNYCIIAEVLRKHANDIIENPNTGAIGSREYVITPSHGTIKAVISWIMT